MNLSERLRLVVETVTPPTRRFVALEERTEIKAETWRTWWNRGGKASADMIQAVAESYPEYAFWIATGVEDFAHGHTSPLPQGERSVHRARRERTAARDYFAMLINQKKSKMDGATPTQSLNNPNESQEGYFERELYELWELREQQEKAIDELMKRGLPKELVAIEAQGGLPAAEPD